MSTSSSSRLEAPPAAVHVDLDGATDVFHAHGWAYRGDGDPLFETGMRNLLDFLDRYRLRATLFLIAGSLDQPAKRRLVEEALQRGHEIASHSITHPNLLRLSRQEKQQEIEGSRRKIESELGITIRGFRAPGYSMDREGLELVAAAGYLYDSSAFPTTQFARRLGTEADALLAPHQPIAGRNFWELPLPDHRPSPFPFSPSYALLFGTQYFRWGAERFRRRGIPMFFLLHLTDIADPMPPNRLMNLRARIFTLSHISREKKLERCQSMLDWVRKHFRMATTREIIDEWAARNEKDPAEAKVPE